jgi:hypothetical protein
MSIVAFFGYLHTQTTINTPVRTFVNQNHNLVSHRSKCRHYIYILIQDLFLTNKQSNSTPCAHKAAKPRSHKATKPQSHEATKPQSHKATKPRSHEATKPRSHKATMRQSHKYTYAIAVVLGSAGTFSKDWIAFITVSTAIPSKIQANILLLEI